MAKMFFPFCPATLGQAETKPMGHWEYTIFSSNHILRNPPHLIYISLFIIYLKFNHQKNQKQENYDKDNE